MRNVVRAILCQLVIDHDLNKVPYIYLNMLVCLKMPLSGEHHASITLVTAEIHQCSQG